MSLGLLRCVAAAALAAALAGCARPPVYRVGAPDEISQVLMAEMVAEGLRGAGARAVRTDCGSLRACVLALRGGELDLLPAYSGDAVALVRMRDKTDVTDLDQVRRAFSVLDLMMTRDLGFEVRYVVVMRADRAAREGIDTISGLAGLEGGVRMALPADYAGRPGDGLYALSRRHGLALAAAGPLVLADAGDRLAAVLERRADAAVIRDFGSDLAGLGLVRLADARDFFEPYRAALLVGPAASAAFAWIQGALAPMVGRIEAGDMRRLTEEVVVQGWPPGLAARRLLVEKGITAERASLIRRPPIVLAVDPRDDLGGQEELASRVIARAFPGRPVELLPWPDPFEALATGRAEIALADAARFYAAGPEGSHGRRDDRAEVAAVLGERRLYLLCGTRGRCGPDPLAGEVGVQRRGSSGAQVAGAILHALGREAALHRSTSGLVDALAEGRIEAALLLAPAVSTTIVQALEGGIATLESLAPHVAEVPLYLGEARIPAGRIPGQVQPLDLFSLQLLLAGPAPPLDFGLRAGGPAAAIRTAGQPLTLDQAEALARASPGAERPDPVLPSIWERVAGRDDAARAIAADAVDTALNAGLFVFVLWVLTRVVRRDRIRPAEAAAEREDDRAV